MRNTINRPFRADMAKIHHKVYTIKCGVYQPHYLMDTAGPIKTKTIRQKPIAILIPFFVYCPIMGAIYSPKTIYI